MQSCTFKGGEWEKNFVGRIEVKKIHIDDNQWNLKIIKICHLQQPNISYTQDMINLQTTFPLQPNQKCVHVPSPSPPSALH